MVSLDYCPQSTQRHDFIVRKDRCRNNLGLKQHNWYVLLFKNSLKHVLL